MGITYVDKDTFGHFCGGVLSCLLYERLLIGAYTIDK